MSTDAAEVVPLLHAGAESMTCQDFDPYEVRKGAGPRCWQVVTTGTAALVCQTCSVRSGAPGME